MVLIKIKPIIEPIVRQAVALQIIELKSTAFVRQTMVLIYITPNIVVHNPVNTATITSFIH